MFAFNFYLCDNFHMKDQFMKSALIEAEKARKKNEVPIGAVIVKDGKIISKGYNQREKKQNALLHAEVIAINKACKKLKSWRLNGCDIYITLEPCLMCFGAILNSRIDNIYFGAYDKSGSSISSNSSLLEKSILNHKLKVEGGILEKECSQILTNFFKENRR